MAEQTDPRLLAVLDRIAGALEKLAARDRGERPDLEPTNEWVKQQRDQYEREGTGAPHPDTQPRRLGTRYWYYPEPLYVPEPYWKYPIWSGTDAPVSLAGATVTVTR